MSKENKKDKVINNHTYLTPNLEKSGKAKGEDFKSKVGKALFNEKNANGEVISPAVFDQLQGEENNVVADVLLGGGYLFKEADGSVIPNYNVMIEAFLEQDNTIDFKQFVDVRKASLDQKFNFDTDSIVGVESGNTNDVLEIFNDRNVKKKDTLTFIVNTEWKTVKSVLNLKDNEDTRIGFDIKASDFEQHSRAERIYVNSFILNLMTTGATNFAGYVFDDTLTGSAYNTALIELGENIFLDLEKIFLGLEELMTAQRPGGFSYKDFGVLASPLVEKALKKYVGTLSTGDIHFREQKDAVFAAEGSKWELLDVAMYKTNMLVDGNNIKVEVEPNGGGAPTTITLFENTERIEVIVFLRNYTKYADAPREIISSPTNVDGVARSHIHSQWVEGVHGGGTKNPELYATINVYRVSKGAAPTGALVGSKINKKAKKKAKQADKVNAQAAKQEAKANAQATKQNAKAQK